MSINWFPRCGGCSSRNASGQRSFLQGIAPCIASTTSSMFEPKLLASPEDFKDLSPVNSMIATKLSQNSLDEECAFRIWELPDQILVQIFSFFRPQDVCRAIAPVCRRWYMLAYSNALWRTVDMQIRTFRHQWHVKRVLTKMSSAVWKLSFLVQDEPLSCPALVAQGTIPHLPSLSVLDLGFNRGLELAVIDFIVDQCPNVYSVNLEGAKEITDLSIQVIVSGWLRLENVCLSHCVNVTDAGVCHLAQKVKKLRLLNIDGISCISDVAIECLAMNQANHLQRLYLDGADLTDLALFFLMDCTKLELLSVSFCEAFTDSSLNYLKGFKSLQHLHLRKGLDLSVEGFKSLFESDALKNVRYLNLAECSAINDSCVHALTKHCPHLRSLCLSWCWSVTDTGLQAIVRRLNGLSLLCLEGIKQLRGDPFAENMPSCLAFIDLCSCNLVSFRDLILLDLVGLDLVQGFILAHIPERFLPKIRFIDLRQCNVIEDKIVQELVVRKSDLTVANYYGELWDQESLAEQAEKRPHCIEREHLKHILDRLPGGCCMTAV